MTYVIRGMSIQENVVRGTVRRGEVHQGTVRMPFEKRSLLSK